jgi:ParB/RepB/Spo0J family partition protein
MTSTKPPILTAADPNSILPPAFSVRTGDEDEAIMEFTETVKQTGVVQPIICMGTASGIVLIAGGRRLNAAKKAMLTSVPILLYGQLSDADALHLQMIENDHRKDLTDYEWGRGFKYVLEHHRDRYPNQESIAKRLGKSPTWVSRQISAFEMAEELKALLWIQKLPRGNFEPSEIEHMPEKQLRELRAASPEKRLEILMRLKAKPVESRNEKLMSANRIRKEVLQEKPSVVIKTFDCDVCRTTITAVHYSPTEHALKNGPTSTTISEAAKRYVMSSASIQAPLAYFTENFQEKFPGIDYKQALAACESTITDGRVMFIDHNRYKAF